MIVCFLRFSFAIAALFMLFASQPASRGQERGGNAAKGRASATLPVVWKPLRPFGDISFPEYVRPRIGIVLSGGGARGLAQIGVLRALEEAGLVPDLIVGTSIGSIVGGLYSSGYSSDELEQTIKGIDWDDLLRLSNQSGRENLFVDQKPLSDRSILTLRFDGLRPMLPMAVSNGQRLTNLLNELALRAVYHSKLFDELRVSFRAVATDLYTGRRLILDRGSLAEAMRASSTVPVLYSPVMRDSLALVDGGLVSNIPVDVAKQLGCEIVIAVNTSSPPRSAAQITNPAETLDQVMNVMMEANNRQQLLNADIVIEPVMHGVLATDFSLADTLISLGYHHTLRQLPALKAVLLNACRAMIARNSASQAQDMNAAHEDSTDTTLEQAVPAMRIASADIDSLSGVLFASCMPHAGREHAEYPLRSTLIRDIRITGMDTVHAIRLSGETSTFLFTPMNGIIVRRVCEAVLRYYRSNGYALASIRHVDVDTSRGVLSIRVTEGTINGIDIVGNQRTAPLVILRELPFRSGQTFRLSDAREGLNNVEGLGLFHQVSLEVEELDDEARIRVRVEERPSQELRVGILVDNERNAQFGIDLRDANIFGSGSEIMGQFFGGFKNRHYEAAYNSNRLFYTNLNFSLQAYYDLRDYNVFTESRETSAHQFEREATSVARRVTYGASASAGMYASRFGNVFATLRYEEQAMRTIEQKSDAVVPFDESQRVVSLTVGTTIDTRDKYPYPTKGMHFAFAYTSSQSALGSTRPFVKVRSSYGVYVSNASQQWTLGPRVMFGYGDRTMPRTEDFRLGGMNMFHGMLENSFTGQQLLVAGIEARWRLPLRILFDTFLSARYDLGRTWEVPEQIKFGDLRHGFGISLGLDTPIGPADFSIGQSMFFDGTSGALKSRFGPTNLSFSIGTGL